MSRNGRNPADNGAARGRAEAPSTRQPSNARWLAPILIAAVVVVGAAAAMFLIRPEAGGSSGASGAAAVGGPFQLVDQDGRAVDQTILDGKWSAVFFGYTFCPDVCPATLTALGAAKQKLGDRARDLQVVFVSIDPERDTPEQVKAYVSSPVFPQPTIGLTGTPEQVAAAAKAYKAYYAKAGDGPGYLMDHVSAIYLMNPQGKFERLIRTDAGPDQIAADIGAAMGRS